MKKVIFLLLLLTTTLIVTLISLSFSQTFIKNAGLFLLKKQIPTKNISHKKLNFTYENINLLKKKISFDADELCFQDKCISKLKLSLTIDLLNPLNYKIQEISFNATGLQFNSQDSTDEENPISIKIGDILKLIKTYFPAGRIHKIDINLSEILFNDLEIEMILSANNTSLIKGDIGLRKKDLFYQANFRLSQSNDLSLQVDSELKTKDILLKNKTQLSLKKNSALISFDLTSLQMKSLDLTIPKCSTDFLYGSSINLNCNKMLLALSNDMKFKLDTTLRIENHITQKDIPDKEIILFSLKGKEFQNKSFNLKLYSKLGIYIEKNKFKLDLAKADLAVNIPSFSRLTEDLKNSEFSIPAPFNTLQGDIDFSLDLKKLRQGYKLPMKGEMNLDKAKYTKLKTSYTGEVEIKEDFSLKEIFANIEITEAKFYIPNIDPLKGIPELSPISNINKELRPPSKKKKLNFKYDIKVNTKSLNSIKLYNQLFTPYLALGIKANIKNTSSDFEINVSQVSNLTYLRREIKVKKAKVSTKKGITTIDSKFLYQVAGYDIYLNIIGTAGAPRLILTSKPSLPREDIVSLLIYGRRSNQISNYNRESVGNAEAAITDRAVGLFSIWAFASTPIDSVSYNPKNKTYSATVSIPGNMSVNIGSNWETLNSLSLRKRLTNTWSVVTSVETLESNESELRESIMLQKEVSF